MFRIARALMVGLAVLMLTGCSGVWPLGNGKEKPRLNGSGASFILPMMSKWAAEYDKARGVEVNYQSIGSGGGIQQMTVRTADFGCSDGPMNDEQLAKAREIGGAVLHIPLVLGAVVPIYNLAEVSEPLVFSGPVLADIYLGKIKKWNDPALQNLNPGVNLPDKNIGVVRRSDGSGATYVWAEYLAKVSPEWHAKVGVGTSVDWPTGEGANGNPGVASRVQATPGCLGYVELLYAVTTNVQYGRVKNRHGVAIRADRKSISAAAEHALTDIPDDLRFSLTDAAGPDSYPIACTSWAIFYVHAPSDRGKHVVDFVRWCTHEGHQYCEGLHYVKLPPRLLERIDKKLDLVRMK